VSTGGPVGGGHVAWEGVVFEAGVAGIGVSVGCAYNQPDVVYRVVLMNGIALDIACDSPRVTTSIWLWM